MVKVDSIPQTYVLLESFVRYPNPEQEQIINKQEREIKGANEFANGNPHYSEIVI